MRWPPDGTTPRATQIISVIIISKGRTRVNRRYPLECLEFTISLKPEELPVESRACAEEAPTISYSFQQLSSSAPASDQPITRAPFATGNT